MLSCDQYELNILLQQTQALPVSLQQFLRLNPTDIKKAEPEIEMEIEDGTDDKKEEPVAEAVLSEGNIMTQYNYSIQSAIAFILTS